MLSIDSATGTVFEAIGAMLTKNGIEDASGARREIERRLASGNYDTAAIFMGCEREEALAIAKKFGIAPSA